MRRPNRAAVEVLNTLLRDELAAVETYDEALRGCASSGEDALSRCRRSHETRVAILHEKILALGGRPTTGIGIAEPWRARLELGRGAFSDDVAMRALERGEDSVLHDYRAGMATAPPEVRSFIQRALMPEERFTHRTLNDLVHHPAAPR